LQICTFVHFVLLLQFQVEKLLVPVHDPVLKLDWDFVASDLEEAIVQTAISHFLYQLFLRCGIAFIKLYAPSVSCKCMNEKKVILEKSRIGGASPALGMLVSRGIEFD